MRERRETSPPCLIEEGRRKTYNISMKKRTSRDQHIGLFFGCTILLFKELRNALEAFFRKAKIPYEPLGIDQCCGIPLLLGFSPMTEASALFKQPFSSRYSGSSFHP